MSLASSSVHPSHILLTPELGQTKGILDKVLYFKRSTHEPLRTNALLRCMWLSVLAVLRATSARGIVQ